MNELRLIWLETARNPRSLRHMFALADDISRSAEATVEDRRAARKVVRVLEDVIDKPIAEAARLAKARRRFDHLKDALQQSQNRS